MTRLRRPGGVVLFLAAVGCLAAVSFSRMTVAAVPGTGSATPAAGAAAIQDAAQTGETRAWRIVARKYSYSEPRIEVRQDDIVKITLETADIPHSFTIDEPYRIAKRAAPGHPVVFEFRADMVGTFEFYCNLKTDEGCRKMKGQLVVTAR
jgi:heme/copper-type cytochrome/quinol oxidase subunit 2